MENNLENLFLPKLQTNGLAQISPLAMAFIGDGVHTLFVRDECVKSQVRLSKDYHNICAGKCNAKAQAIKLEGLLEMLDDDEKDIIRRARNAKIHHTAKNFDEETYKKATAFEALVGYLYLIGRYDRIKYILCYGE